MSIKRQLAALFLLAVIVAGGLVASFSEQKNSQKTAALPSGKTFTIASYNVENFFDLVPNGSEYPEYIPNFKSWEKRAYETKLSNVSKVIADMDAAVVGLQEIENENVLLALRQRLEKNSKPYPHSAISHNERSAVQVALLSRFPIVKTEEFEVPKKLRERPILKVTLDVNGEELVVFVNHWKAKTGPESQRLDYARTLRAQLDRLPADTDAVALGDFNCNHDEMLTFLNDKKLNDTGGFVGINHIVATATSRPDAPPKLATIADVAAQSGTKLLYDPWQSLPKHKRVSELFARRSNTPDHILITKALLDKKGVSFVEDSFAPFTPDYLFSKGVPFRWQMGRGKAPQGFSDHLPIIAKFSIGAFGSQAAAAPAQPQPTTKVQKSAEQSKDIKELTIAQLYDKQGDIDAILKKCVVIYRHNDKAVVKQPNGRSIFVYGAPENLQLGGVYDLRVTKLELYNGLMEIKNIFDLKKTGSDDPKKYFLTQSVDFSQPKYQNEIVSLIEGYYSRGMFKYGERQIKLYFADKNLKPKGLTKLKLLRAHIGHYREPQLIIYQKEDFEVVD